VATAAQQFETFLSRYSPEVQASAKKALAKLRKLIPGAVELVYDNYNALVVGFGPSERASEAPISIALYPRWVNLFFLRGKNLSDPHKLLKGSGNIVRHIVLDDAALLDDSRVRALIAQAVAGIEMPSKRRMVIRAISAKRRARQPL
jgi:hypothetical protein